MEFDLASVWAGLIAFAVLAYVVLDGFDLGIGVLFPFLDGDDERGRAMNSVAPVWDGNETWLVLGGGGLYAVFPLAYATILPALYAPLVAMLIGLVFRGVAFEFRWRNTAHRRLWDWSFTAGSLVAAFAQGVALGALVKGIPVVDRAYAGGWWNWLTPFSLLTGAALTCGYALLGAAWLVMKTEGLLQARARSIALWLALATLGLIGIVSLITPFLDPIYLSRWFAWPAALYSGGVPLLLLGCAAMLITGLRGDSEVRPFVSALGIFVLCFVGIGIGFYPHIVPPSLTIEEAAAPEKSLAFLLVGAAVLIPIILAYTAYAYWVFRGKTGSTEHYH